MFLGEKEKKQLNIPTIAVSRRVRETRARGWRGSSRGHGDGAPHHCLSSPGRAAAATPNLQPCKSAGSKHQRRFEKLNTQSDEKNLMLQHSDLQGPQIGAEIRGTNMLDWLKNVISL